MVVGGIEYLGLCDSPGVAHDSSSLDKFDDVLASYLFERSEFQIPIRGTSQKENPSVCGCVCSTNLGFSVEKIVLVLVWGTSEKKKERLVPASASLPTAGSALHRWAGRLRFSGAATLTQSRSFAYGAGLQSESRLLLCCAPAVYMLAADTAVFGLEHLISYCNKKIVLVFVWGTSERLIPAKKKQNAWYQRALRCQLRGRPFHPGQGDSASLVKPTLDQRR